MQRNTNLSPADLVGYQYPLLYGRYIGEIKKIVEKELSKEGTPEFDFSWLICKVFLLGTIAGVRKERARRRTPKKDRKHERTR